MPHMPPASAWEARARAARREADVFALTADLFWARQDPAGDTWHADYRHAVYRHEMSKVVAAQTYAALCETTADNIRRASPDCAGCGHPASHHDDGTVCWTRKDGSETSENDAACPCSWYRTVAAAADGAA